MRLVTLMLLFGLVPLFGLGQNKIEGKIVDELGFPVYLASVELSGTDIVTHTDYEGFFMLTSEKSFHWKINITSKGYKPESFFVLDGGNAGNIVLEFDAEMKELLQGTSSADY
nr:hypothetical protein [Allomuricauda sp.]